MFWEETWATFPSAANTFWKKAMHARAQIRVVTSQIIITYFCWVMFTWCRSQIQPLSGGTKDVLLCWAHCCSSWTHLFGVRPRNIPRNTVTEHMQCHQLKVCILPFWILAKPKADLTDASSVESSPLFLWISTLSTPLEELAEAHGSPACMAVMFRTYCTCSRWTALHGAMCSWHGVLFLETFLCFQKRFHRS